MNRLSILSLACGMALGVAAMPVLAGPLVPNRVTADATWLFHVDLEAVRNSPFGARLVSNEFLAEMHEEMNAVHEDLGIDPIRDIKSITVSGAEEGEDHGLIVVNATQAVDQAIARIGELVGEYNAITEGTRTIHCWTEGEDDEDGDNDRMYAYVIQGTDPDDRVIAFCESIEQLRTAMVRLEAPAAGELPPVLQRATPRPGSFVFFSAQDISSIVDDQQAAAMLRSADSVYFEAGQDGNELFAQATLHAPTDAEATSISQIITGLTAMGRMVLAEEPRAAELGGFIDAVRVTADGPLVRLNFRYDSEAAFQVLSRLADTQEHEEGNAERAADPDAAHPQADGVKVKVKTKKTQRQPE